jgi:hypothetical protein
MTNSLVAASQNATAYSAPIAKTCRFCGKDGLLILPLITAALPATAGAPALPGTACAHIKSIAIKESSYTLRMARVGYLYMLVNRKGNLSWQCYMATAQGYWSQFAADAPPLEAPEFTCEPSTHGINASMVDIHQAADVETAYLLFTPSPLTVKMLSEKELKSTAKADKLCALGQMVKFSPKAWITGSYTQTDCLQAKDLVTSVAEFALASKNSAVFTSPLGKALSNATFPLMHDGHSAESPLAVAAGHLSRLPSLINTISDKKAVVIAMYDPIGIAQTLNDFRNDGLNKIDDYLKTADKDKVSNKWKFESLQAVREIQTGIQTRLMETEERSAKWSENVIRANYEPLFPDDSAELRKLKATSGNGGAKDPDRTTWPQRDPKRYAELQARLAQEKADQPVQLAKAREEAKQKWDKKYAPLLDAAAMAKFDAEFDAATKAATDLASKRVDDHLAWVLHDRLVEAFDVYDRADVYNVANKALNTHSGKFFEGQAALCTLGMVGCEKSAAQVDAWLAGSIGDKKNIYMRGLLLNQEAIEKEAKTALEQAAGVALAAGTTSAIPVEKLYKVVKGAADLFKKADGAWDEFLRNQAQAKTGFGKTKEGALLFKLSEWNRGLFRKGITKFEMEQVGKRAGFLLARMGGLAETLAKQELLKAIDPQSPHPSTPMPEDPKAQAKVRNAANIPTTTTDVPNRPNVNPERAGMTAKQVAQQVDPALKKLMTDAQFQHQERVQGITHTVEEYLAVNKTNNYHQARIGVLLGAMETIALGTKVFEMMQSGKASKLQIVEAAANVMSVASIGYDVSYAMAKSIREAVQDTAIKGSGDIIRGGFKMWAGSLGAVAGGLGIWADIIKLLDERDHANRTGQKTMLWIKIAVGTSNTVLSGMAAFSYSGPMLRRAEINLATSALNRRAVISFVARKAEWLALRVLLLRAVAWVSGAGFVLTIGELAYYGYQYFEPSELETWCKRSAFRSASLGTTPFTSADLEMTELAKARTRTKL